jgi:hypothetical protein
VSINFIPLKDVIKKNGGSFPVHCRIFLYWKQERSPAPITSVADPDPDPVPLLHLDPGSGMGKKSGSGSGMNNPNHTSESLETIFLN